MSSKKISQKKANILIVDDTRDDLRFLVQTLENEGYKVRPAPDGKSALRAVQCMPMFPKFSQPPTQNRENIFSNIQQLMQFFWNCLIKTDITGWLLST